MSESSTTPYHVIVIGAGVEGSSTAYQLSRRGVRVLLLEQFNLPHTRGSSHGQTRITRKAYAQPFYTNMMEYSTQEWTRLQQAFGQTLYKKIGYLAIGHMDGDLLRSNITSMDANNSPYDLLTPATFRLRYPFLQYGDDWGGLLDPEGGTLLADKALRAYQSQFVKHGGEIIDGEKVMRINPGEITEIVTTRQTYKCYNLVLCCGPWTNKLLKPLDISLPLQPVRISVCYWPEKEPGTHSPEKLPTFFEINEKGREIYGLPSEEYPGHVKICLHNGPSIDPDLRDAPDSQWTVDLAKDYVRTHFPGLEAHPSVVESCIYTFTPDKNFILDRHPKWKNILIGAGFSGHGFKLSPAVGHILADLAMGLPPKYDIGPFKIDRFSDTYKPSAKL